MRNPTVIFISYSCLKKKMDDSEMLASLLNEKIAELASLKRNIADLQDQQDELQEKEGLVTRRVRFLRRKLDAIPVEISASSSDDEPPFTPPRTGSSVVRNLFPPMSPPSSPDDVLACKIVFSVHPDVVIVLTVFFLSRREETKRCRQT
jgi:hypothetical protein